MSKVRFYNPEEVDDALLRFAVIVAKTNSKWVYCKHRKRDTFENPGGHREPGETIEETARRELFEETGAVDFSLTPLVVYSVTHESEIVNSSEESFGMLFAADIHAFGPLPPSEIESVSLFDTPPENQTYPDIQPFLCRKTEQLMTKGTWQKIGAGND